MAKDFAPLPYPMDSGVTHYPGCYREKGHHDCAILMIEKQAKSLAKCQLALHEIAAPLVFIAVDARIDALADLMRKRALLALADTQKEWPDQNKEVGT